MLPDRSQPPLKMLRIHISGGSLPSFPSSPMTEKVN
jgi:hypothetical protein